MYRTLAIVSALALTQIGAVPSSGFTVSKSADGVLTATLYTPGASGKFEYFSNGGNCDESASSVPCYGFLAANGTDAVKTSGANCNDAGYCAETGVRTVRVVVENGGTFSTSCGPGCHAGDCFSSLTIQAKAGSGDVYGVNVDDGCAETVICSQGTGSVQIDSKDVVKGCSMVTKGG